MASFYPFFSQLAPCVWHQCIDPPLPEDHGLKRIWDEKPVEFGDKIRYECEKETLFFEHDREISSFSLECLDDGSFDTPEDDDWLKCVSSKPSFSKKFLMIAIKSFAQKLAKKFKNVEILLTT